MLGPGSGKELFHEFLRFPRRYDRATKPAEIKILRPHIVMQRPEVGKPCRDFGWSRKDGFALCKKTVENCVKDGHLKINIRVMGDRGGAGDVVFQQLPE